MLILTFIGSIFITSTVVNEPSIIAIVESAKALTSSLLPKRAFAKELDLPKGKTPKGNFLRISLLS